MWFPRFVDSHTLGEPTRVVLDPPAELAALPAAERPAALRGPLAHLRAAVIGGPRTASSAVGAFLFPPETGPARSTLLFFDSAGPLGMCVHGAIGVAATLAHIGELSEGSHIFDTPAGPIAVALGSDGSVRVENVPSRRVARRVPIATSGGPLAGEICYGGNWFFHIDPSPLPIEPGRLDALLALAREVRAALDFAEISGERGAPIDHVGFFERRDPAEGGVHARNFVLCPSGEYDRSPCGTGTSAWLAARHADGELAEGTVWTVESVAGARFEGSVRLRGDGAVVPSIRGRATVTAYGRLFAEGAPPDDARRR